MKIQAIAVVFLVAISGQCWSQAILPLGAYDANQDGKVADSDAWAIMDYVYDGGTSPIHPGSSRQSYNVTAALADYYGSAPDSYVTAIDAIRVINFINGTKIHRNPTQAVDVNGNGYASSLDALLIINYLNQGGPVEPLTSNVAYQILAWPSFPYPFTLGFQLNKPGAIYYDVNGDYKVTSADAQAVIDWLNAHP